MDDLSVTLIQTELYWEDIEANLKAFDATIDGIPEPTDVIVLPEMFTTGFSMDAPRFAQEMTGSAVSWIKEASRKKSADVMGSVIIRENGNYFNRVLWAKPDGSLFTYDKKHLFRMIGEHKVFTPGEKHLTVAVKDWKLRPFICYDMRFPIWTRNIDNAYDVAVFIANWPEKRAPHWKLLMPARAVENQCYVIGVNRVGKDGKGFPHSGDSAVIDPMGNIVFQKAHESFVRTFRLTYDRITFYREKFAAWMDADGDAVSFFNTKRNRSEKAG
ncbi:MAG: amidohydrolase [Desulfobacterales bacterium]